MIRIVIDTNVIVSGSFWTNAPSLVLKAVNDGKVIQLVTEAILAEWADVFSRAKFAMYLKTLNLPAAQFIDLLRKKVEIVQPAPVPAGVIRDPKDEMILACAVGGKADYIVSGDSDLLDLKEYERIPIISVIEFLQKLDETDET